MDFLKSSTHKKVDKNYDSDMAIFVVSHLAGHHVLCLCNL